MLFTRENVIERLKKGEVSVQFTKKSTGELRSMLCTLNPGLIPTDLQEQSDPTKEISGRKVNVEVVSVWDLEKNDWRSFRVDSIISIVE